MCVGSGNPNRRQQNPEMPFNMVIGPSGTRVFDHYPETTAKYTLIKVAVAVNDELASNLRSYDNVPSILAYLFN